MRIDDEVFFALVDGESPAIRFEDLDWSVEADSCALPSQLEQRFRTLYLNPAQNCASRGDAFATGLLIVAALDAIARLRLGSDWEVGKRFQWFAKEYCSSLAAGDLAKRLYEEFRNGLVHQGMIKKGSQFSVGMGGHAAEGDLLVLDAEVLEADLREGLARFANELRADRWLRTGVAVLLRRDFAELS
jgi:hypothetical protein